MSDAVRAMLAALEPTATATDCRGAEQTALVSIAISLKRIADWLEGNGPAHFTDRVTDAISAGLHHGFASNRR